MFDNTKYEITLRFSRLATIEDKRLYRHLEIIPGLDMLDVKSFNVALDVKSLVKIQANAITNRNNYDQVWVTVKVEGKIIAELTLQDKEWKLTKSSEWVGKAVNTFPSLLVALSAISRRATGWWIMHPTPDGWEALRADAAYDSQKEAELAIRMMSSPQLARGCQVIAGSRVTPDTVVAIMNETQPVEMIFVS